MTLAYERPTGPEARAPLSAVTSPGHLPLRVQPLLALDPDLACDLDELQQRAARRIVRAGVLSIPPGAFALTTLTDALPTLAGVIVLDGILGREFGFQERRSLHLLAAGDVLLPDPPDEESLLGQGPTLTALTRVTVAALDESFLHAAARWPSLLMRLHERLATQQSREAALSLVLHLSRAEDRVLMTLWLLAQQCGRMTGDGLLLPLSFTHEALSQITAARRPTVSLALKQLQADGAIVACADGQTLLTGQAQERVQALTAECDGCSTPSLMVRAAQRGF